MRGAPGPPSLENQAITPPGPAPAAYGSSPAIEAFHRATGTMNVLREPASHPNESIFRCIAAICSLSS